MIARTYPPAKLNLFLELLARREDGYHEIDTVMVPIDWRDELRLQIQQDDRIDLQVEWSPSREAVAKELGVEADADASHRLLHLPTNEKNLVALALRRFRDVHEIEHGFSARLIKQIPAGAGMGGASSDAASALRCAARLCDVPSDAQSVVAIAEEIGSDVPFFLGLGGDRDIAAARATGRGEQLSQVDLSSPIPLVAVFPAVSVSTAEVYSIAQLPTQPVSPSVLLEKLSAGTRRMTTNELVNRLAEPAKKLAPRINQVLESFCRLGLNTCQMTGSGSACFAIADSTEHAERVAADLREQLQPGAFVRSVRTITVPVPIDLIPLDKS